MEGRDGRLENILTGSKLPRRLRPPSASYGQRQPWPDEEELPGNAPSNALLRCAVMGCKDEDMLGCGGVPAGSTMAFLTWLRSCPPVDRAAAPPLRPLTGWDKLGLLFNRSTLRVWNRVKPADKDA